ncbi:MAG: alpha/beta hydrolase [Acetobacteraceae bacterium]|nr:alpha/beta hydrolase [Acetobacteraceae bacterium]
MSREAGLADEVRTRTVDNINGLSMHVLEAGDPGRPCLLLLHGFPELAYSWRKVMLPLAAAGYFVIAPDQRGYGRTEGWDTDYDGDLASYRMLNLARDALGLVAAYGYRHVAAVIGHDFGSSVAGWCALTRPDVFRAVALMSAPFGGPPALPFDTIAHSPQPVAGPTIHAALAALPRPRKHYHWYYSNRVANADMRHCAQGVHDFLRAYYHHKSADWVANKPFRLTSWTARELAKLPTYYVMDLQETMAESVAHEMPTAAEIAANLWLPEAELAVYAEAYERNGFQGGLQWYRCRTVEKFDAEHALFSGRTIDVPATFIAGTADWGVRQTPGALEAMESRSCARYLGTHLIDGAGHWVQQEQPEAVTRLVLDFLQQATL